MSEEQLRQLQRQLWNIANTLRGKMNADDIFFIDASRDFEKVKTQNRLLPEHITKIVNAYLTRANAEKYSYVASIKSIRTNDYNLNIPRYVDTFEAEDTIDLDAIAGQLRSLEQDSLTIDAIITAFFLELGIKPPF